MRMGWEMFARFLRIEQLIEPLYQLHHPFGILLFRDFPAQSLHFLIQIIGHGSFSPAAIYHVAERLSLSSSGPQSCHHAGY